MRQILTNHRWRIQRSIIYTRNWVIHIHGTFGRKHNRTFITLITARLFQIRHECLLFTAFFSDETGQFDTLTTKHQETDGHAANTRHLHIASEHIYFVHKVVDQVTILNAVFRHDGAPTGIAVSQSENILGRHIILRHTPFDALFHIDIFCLMSCYNNYIVFYYGLYTFDNFSNFIVTNNINYGEFLAIFIIVRGETRYLNMNKITFM